MRIRVVLRDLFGEVLSTSPDGTTCKTFTDARAARAFCATQRFGFTEAGAVTGVARFTVRIDGGPAREFRAGAIL